MDDADARLLARFRANAITTEQMKAAVIEWRVGLSQEQAMREIARLGRLIEVEARMGMRCEELTRLFNKGLETLSATQKPDK
jgi:hypothetical protein